jgi:hypothetical protein
MPIAGVFLGSAGSKRFSDVEMLRVAGVNQEDRYQSGGSQNALIWPAVKYDASLTNKHPTARLPTMSLPLKAPAGPLRAPAI